MREELEKLKKLKLEAKQLEDELRKVPCTKDSVKGSMTEHPYIEQTIRICGVDEHKAKKVRKRLEYKLEELQEAISAMEDYLDTVDDPEMRTILRLYYRNGLTQGQIGAELGYDRSVISRKLKFFWENQTCTQNTQLPV
ncbi:MAG: hypothetical protein PHE79_11535 [Eubacteriales bacterium]|nr:hypothetical protein [Eubacteriales bacterium]